MVAIVTSTVIIEVDVTRGSVTSILLSDVIGKSSLVDKTPDDDGTMYTAVVSSGMPSVVSISYKI